MIDLKRGNEVCGSLFLFRRLFLTNKRDHGEQKRKGIRSQGKNRKKALRRHRILWSKSWKKKVYGAQRKIPWASINWNDEERTDQVRLLPLDQTCGECCGRIRPEWNTGEVETRTATVHSNPASVIKINHDIRKTRKMNKQKWSSRNAIQIPEPTWRDSSEEKPSERLSKWVVCWFGLLLVKTRAD